MKKLFSLLLAITLCVISMPCNVNAKAKSKAITVKQYEEYTLDNITYKMPKGWEESSDSDVVYYYYNDNNFIMVQTEESEVGFESELARDAYVEGFTSEDGFSLISSKEKDFKDGITALLLDLKLKDSGQTYYLKNFTFVYDGKLYSFTIVSDLQKNTKILDKLTNKIVIGK